MGKEKKMINSYENWHLNILRAQGSQSRAFLFLPLDPPTNRVRRRMLQQYQQIAHCSTRSVVITGMVELYASPHQILLQSKRLSVGDLPNVQIRE